MSSSENIQRLTPQGDPPARRSLDDEEIVAFKQGLFKVPHDWACPSCAEFRKEINIYSDQFAMCPNPGCDFIMDPTGNDLRCTIWLCDCCIVESVESELWLNWIQDQQGETCGLANCGGRNCKNWGCGRPLCGRLLKREDDGYGYDNDNGNGNGDGNDNNNDNDNGNGNGKDGCRSKCGARLGPAYLLHNGGFLVYTNQEEAEEQLKPWWCRKCTFYNEDYSKERQNCKGCRNDKVHAVFVVKREKSEVQLDRERELEYSKT